MTGREEWAGPDHRPGQHRGHGHHHGHHHAGAGVSPRRALRWALGANAAYLVVEVVGAFAFGSLALLADGVHMLSDVAALTIALIAQSLSERPASSRHTYGLQRSEVIGAQANALLLLGAASWIAVTAAGRIGDAPEIDGVGVAIVAAIGLAVNVVSAVGLARASGRSLNVRGASWHLASDALGSVGALAAGVAAAWWDARDVDVYASLLVAALVVVAGLRLLRDATSVLLEAVPAGISVEDLVAEMADVPGIDAVHHVHVWSLGSDVPALSAHLLLDGEPTLHEAQVATDTVKAMLAGRFGIEHATLEVECHPCDSDPGAHPA